MVSPVPFHTVTEDVLDQLGMKPSWEVWREYAYRTSIALVAVLALSPQIRFNCLYHSDKHFSEVVLTEVQTNAVNPYCKEQVISWYLYHGDLIAFGMVIILYVATCYWTHLGGVKNRLKNIAKVVIPFLDDNISVDEMKNSAAIPTTKSSKKEHRHLREIVKILTDDSVHTSVRSSYITRCFVLCVATVLCTLFSLLIAFLKFKNNLIVTCEVSNDVIQLRNEAVSTFRCVDEASVLTSILLTIFGVTVFAQFIFSTFALWKVVIAPRRSKNGGQGSQKCLGGTNKDDVANFVTRMMKMSSRQIDNIEKFITFILSENGVFTEEMCEYSDQAILADDLGHFRILKKLLYSNEDKFWATVSESASRVLWDNDSTVQLQTRKRVEKKSMEIDYKVHLFLNQIAKTCGSDQKKADNRNEVTLKEGIQISIPRCRKDTIDSNTCPPESNEDAPASSDLMNKGFTGNKTDFDNKAIKEIWQKQILEKCNWHLLSCIMVDKNAPKCPFDMIPLDKLDGKGRSYLFYLLRKSSLDKMTNRFSHFNEIYHANEDKKLVHFDGKSMSTEDFFRLQYSGMFLRKMPNFRHNKNNTGGQLEAADEKRNTRKPDCSGDTPKMSNTCFSFMLMLMNMKRGDDGTYMNPTSSPFYTDKVAELTPGNPVVEEAIANQN